MERETAFLFTGLIFQKGFEEEIIARLSSEFGKAVLKSEIIPFDFTDYYEKEIGNNLLREWVLFDDPIKPEEIADIKHKTILIEKELSFEGKRRVNIDPGYFTLSKVVLPTTKDCAHRIYLRDNIFAEVTLIYFKSKWQPMQWTYRDYCTDGAFDFFRKCREYILTGKTGEVGSRE